MENIKIYRIHKLWYKKNCHKKTINNILIEFH